jgi:hypothetical protein
MTTLIEGLDVIDNNQSDRDNFEAVVDKFCTAINNYKTSFSNNLEGLEFKSEDNERTQWWGTIVYDSKQSLFVYYICKYHKLKRFSYDIPGFSNEPAISYMKFTENDKGKEINALDWALISTSFYRNTEDYIKFVFDNIIASYTSIYQANIYGYANNPEKTIEETINENFAKEHFKTGPDDKDFIEICATDENNKYPKTCKKLKEYFYWWQNIISSNSENYLNDENIYKAYQKYINKGKEKGKCIREFSTNMIACWLYDETIKGYINLLYNELLFYSLFVDYYWFLLENKPNFKNDSSVQFEKRYLNNSLKVEQITNDIKASKEAIKTTIQILKEIQTTFPIHIWFLLYSEDIYRFSSSMNKTLTPIYTLYDLFRNVQNPY